MAFGATSGPPASAKQIDYLRSLLSDQGFDTFREARHRFGLTQRQASGKFTIGEASDLISRLVDGEDAEESADVVAERAADRADERLQRQREEAVAGIPAEILVQELERRGWRCEPPAGSPR